MIFSTGKIFVLGMLTTLFVLGSTVHAEKRSIVDSVHPAIGLILKSHKELDEKIMFVANHPRLTFGLYELWTVSTLEFMPPPLWVIASTTNNKGEKEYKELSPYTMDVWNEMVATASVDLDNSQKIAKFPITFLGIVAPQEKARWRFSKQEIEGYSVATQKVFTRPWSYRKTGALIEVSFLSSNILGRLSQWKMTIDKQGKIYDIERQVLN